MRVVKDIGRNLWLETRELDAMLRQQSYRKKPVVVRAVKMPNAFTVRTMEGDMTGKAGDYLIEGVQGELYPCDAEIFKATYEEASDE